MVSLKKKVKSMTQSGKEILKQAQNAIDSNNPIEAAGLLKQFLQLTPNAPRISLQLAQIYISQENYDDAEKVSRKAIEYNSQTPMIHATLAEIMYAKGKIDESEDLYRKAVSMNPDATWLINNLGAILIENRKYDEAEREYRKIIELEPDNFVAYSNLAYCLNIQGKSDEAIKNCERTIELNPLCGRAHYMISQSKKYIENDPHIITMEDILREKNNELEPIGKGQIHFALGKAYGDIKKYKLSFEHYKQGNYLIDSELGYVSELHSDLFKKIRKVSTQEFLDNHANAGIKDYEPIFIVGMPRSGTTLLEQILANHTQVFGAGELPYLQEIEKKYGFTTNELSNSDILQMAESYKKRTSKIFSQAKHIVDKMPQNGCYLALIKAMFPNAKILYCRRDPMDICFSIYTRYFLKGVPYGYDLDTLASYCVQFSELMDYYQSLLPDFILEVKYEDLVSDIEGETRKVLDFCNLPWDQNCLTFYDSDKRVETASSLQVKKPIYTSSIGSWKNYEPYLDKLIKALG
jgi:tetratricopeptide (TPR) repeat protein